MITRKPVPLAGLGLLASLTAALALPAPPTSSANTAAAERTIRTAEGFARGRAQDELRAGLVVEEDGSEKLARVTKPKGSGSTLASATSGNFWIFDATTELLFDNDGDGYYHYLRVSFDADTFFTEAYVYAELYLSWDGETWERYFVTEEFLIEGSTSFDAYEVETEFVTGYPTGLYDVLIELYDADFNEFVDEFGPIQSSEFSILPIEDLDHDGLPPSVVTVSHEHGGGGSSSWPWLAFLLAGVAGRHLTSRRRRR